MGCHAQTPVTPTGSATAKPVTTAETVQPTKVTTSTSALKFYPSGLPVGLFGPDYPMNQRIDTLPVDTRLIVATYGPNGSAAATDTVDNHVRTYTSVDHGLMFTAGIPVNVVNSSKHPEILTTLTYLPSENYANESDSVLQPTRAGGAITTRIKLPFLGCKVEDGSDVHCLVWDAATISKQYPMGLLYEAYRYNAAAGTIEQLSIFDGATGKRVRDNGASGANTTSASAGGLSVTAGLARGEELDYAVANHLPDLGHALRMTMGRLRSDGSRSPGWFIAPTTHTAGGDNLSTIGAVMGQRYRTKVGTPMPRNLSARDQVLWNTIARYGLYIDDLGGSFYITVDDAPYWHGTYNFTLSGSGLFAKGLEVVNNGPWINDRGNKDGTLTK